MFDPGRGAPSFVIRIYRRLLRLLPFEFRADFGSHMEQAFADEDEDVRARRSARVTFAFWLRTLRDVARTAPRQHWDILRQDVRLGIRMITRSPGFALAAILTLALGIGGSTGIFSVVYAVVLRPLSFPESDRVVRIGWLRQGGDRNAGLFPLSYSELQAIQQRSNAFDLIGATRHDSLTSEKGRLVVMLPANDYGQPYISTSMASASLFRMFGAQAALGRVPNELDEQPNAPAVAVLSYGTWTSHYGRDPQVIGRTLTRYLGEGRKKAVTIVGVLAPGSMLTDGDPTYEVPAWGMLDPDVLQDRDDSGKELHQLVLYGRLKRGVAADVARAEVVAFTPQFASDRSDWLAAANASLEMTRLHDQVVNRVRVPLLAFLGAVCCLLLVACVNVASLVLARSIVRRQEFAARLALGARPLRVARQLITESALLAASGGVLGLGLAAAIQRAFVAVSPAMPRPIDTGFGAPAVLFALTGVLFATCAAGVIPAWQASRRSVLDGLRRVGGSGNTSTAFSKPLATLAGIEVALVLVLLAGTGLLVNTFGRLMFFDLGFDTKSVALSRIERNVGPPATARPLTSDRIVVAEFSERQRAMRAIDDEILHRVSSVPGVVAAGLTGDNPFGPPFRYGASIQIAGAPRGADAALRIAGPSALDALGMKVIAGRWFTDHDRDGTPNVVVVSENMVQLFWNGRLPLGERLIFGRREAEIIGVVNDIRDRGARQDARPTLYVSTLQVPPEPVMLVMKIDPRVEGVETSVAAELAGLGNRITPGPAKRLADIQWQQLSDARFLTIVLASFTVMTLAVALVGVHGVMRFTVNQRTRELGIRKALGATPQRLRALVLRQAFRFAVPGCVLGLAGALLIGPAVRSLLFGITPSDPATLIVATALVIAAIGLGAYLPARRASAVDPSLSLRAE